MCADARNDDSPAGGPADRRSSQRELAELLEAVPSTLRADVLWAALQMEPSGTLERSYIVGQHRTHFWNWMQAVRPGLAIDAFRLALVAHGSTIYAAVRSVDRASGIAEVEAALLEVMAKVDDALRLWNNEHPE